MKNIKVISIFAIIAIGCTDLKNKGNTSEEIIELRAELDSLKNLNMEMSVGNRGQIATFLTFQDNNAEEAMIFYLGLFDNSKIIDIQKYGKDGLAKEGTIMVATFELNGSKFMCSDSYVKHDWTFTPGVSIWFDCKTENEIETLFVKLSEKGKILMPLDNYGFSKKFAFLEDRFGVSWQLNLN